MGDGDGDVIYVQGDNLWSYGTIADEYFEDAGETDRGLMTPERIIL